MPDAELYRVLVVDDDANTRASLRDLLETDHYAVDTAANAVDALMLGKKLDRYLAVILDRRVTEAADESLVPRLRERAPRLNVIIANGNTGQEQEEETIANARHAVAGHLLKPINADALRANLRRLAERAAAERDLAASAERGLTEAVIETAQAIVLVLDLEGRIVRYNRFMEELSGFTLEEVRGRDWFETFLPTGLRATVQNVFHQAVKGTRTKGNISPILTKSGRQREISWWDSTLHDAQDRVIGLLAIGHDVTELRIAQAKALQSERLAAIGQMVAGLAHESRNALQREQACLEMLALEVQDNPRAIDLLNRAQKAQDDLHRLYEEVRVYAAAVHLEPEPCSPCAVVRAAWSQLAIARQGKSTRLIDLPDDAHLTCVVDRRAMEQVFRNILDNAVAASETAGEIEVSYEAARHHDQPAVRIAIRDHGPGLAPEGQARVFEPFYTTKTQGTGLGMAIVKRLVEAHGGSVRVGSAAGGGTEVEVILPRGDS